VQIPEIERKFLACIMAQPEECRESVDTLKETDFIIGEHKQAYKAFKDVFQSDPSVTTQRLEFALESSTIPLKQRDTLLMDLATLAYSANGNEAYAKTILESSKIRHITETAKQVISEIQHGIDSETATRILSEAINVTDRTAQKIRNSAEMAKTFVDQTKNILVSGVTGIKTGIPWLDDLWAGLEPGDTHMIAGRPGTGKSMLGLQMALEMSRSLEIVFCSLEMGERQNVSRILSNLSGVNSSFIRNATFPTRDGQRIEQSIMEFSKRKFYCPSNMGQSINSIISLSKRAKRNGKIDALFIDYLQLIQSELKGQPRVVVIGDISRRLKLLAAELNIPIILLGQLSRASEQEKRRPILSDLRECGDIEQDVSKIIFLHREGDNTRLIKAKDRHFYPSERLTKLDGATNTFHPQQEEEDKTNGW
jgi:replicative DNA helicase